MVEYLSMSCIPEATQNYMFEQTSWLLFLKYFDTLETERGIHHNESKTMPVEILEAQSNSISDLVWLNDFIQKQHAVDDPDHFRYPLDKNKVVHFFTKILEAKNNRVFLARVQSAPAGYIWFEHGQSYKTPFVFQKKQTFVHHVFVHDDYRRKGIAKRFFDLVQAEAQSCDCEEVILNTYIRNEGAQTFFKSLGFETTKLTMRQTLK